ncbi:DUF2752 domain-containing protein [Mycobacterium asiaticum]|uniref:DUF2752 domain-containing protein n=1 Tax=Mycobacterium asiaticum TaxID=1790 RepID=UPI0007F02F49|nr:DUF2752 domain-containing protein [Mycobacterium asiaticum]OBJ65204.1 hypothetical protein A9W94_08585 [Mycobacterium asiaticum]
MAPDRSSQPATRDPRHRGPAVVGAAALSGALLYIGFADPHSPHTIYPQCPFKWLTGWNCPACGGLRMTHDLLHGDLAASINDNAFLLVGIPLLAAWILVRRVRGQSWLPVPTAVTAVVLMTAWTVVRNLPGFPLVPTVLSG